MMSDELDVDENTRGNAVDDDDDDGSSSGASASTGTCCIVLYFSYKHECESV
jgi:hypothetical protein